MPSISVTPVAGALGAEIGGIDLSQPLNEQQVGAIRRALIDHLVVFFRDQEIEPAQHVALAKYFGDIVAYPLVRGLDGFPEIVPVVKLEHETNNFGGLWHADTTYLSEPPMGAILVARELPPVGGDTLFANMYAAYDTLSEGMKQMLDGLIAISDSAKADVTRTREDRVATDAGDPSASKSLTAEHPVIRTHPESGKKLLFVNYGHTVRFKGMSDAESAPILDYLFRHQTRPEFTCRLTWRPGTIAFWDNRATQHNPINDYHGYKRVLHRITIAGEKPR